MKTLFNRVFDGSDEMFAKAEEEVNKIVAEVGRDAPLTLPSTAYFCACIYAYIGKKVTTTGELQDALADVKAMMLREPRTNSIFQSGVGTAIAAEMIEACKYVKTQTPYEGTNYHGHFTDAEVRELGVPLVTGDIPIGLIVVMDGFMKVSESTFNIASTTALVITAGFMVYTFIRYFGVFREILRSTDGKYDLNLPEEMRAKKERTPKN